MRSRPWLSAALMLAVALGAGACRKFITHPIYRRPVISSVDVFPSTLEPGDSTMITVHATDPDGDSLVYDWESIEGLIIKDAFAGAPYLYNTRSPSMVFYRPMTGPYPSDTVSVICHARDQRGGSDSRKVLVYYKN